MALAGRSAPGAIAETAGALRCLRVHPWALVLLDVRARTRGEGSHQLAWLSAALIVHTRGDNAAITQQIQGVLERWTTQGSARVESTEVNGVRSYRLTDERLPDWAAIRWGAVEGYYVVGIGADAFVDVATGISQTGEKAPAGAWGRLYAAGDAASARVAWGLRCRALRAALGDAMAGRPEGVLAELGLLDTDAVLWSLRRDGRAVVAGMACLRGESVSVTPISQAMPEGAPVQRALPEGATAYAYIPHRPADVITRSVGAWLASWRPEERQRITGAFEQFEQDAQVSVRRDILDHLGGAILIHDHPRHPARLPLADTIVMEIAGEPERVRGALDKLLAQCARWLKPKASADAASTGFWELGLERLPDGVWTLRLGIYGPALVVHDRWVIISYAPAAVRENVARFTAVGGGP